MSDPQPSLDVLLAYLAGAAALLFAITVAFIVIVQTVAPVFGLTPGTPSETVIGILVGAVVTLTTASSARALLALRKKE